MKHRFVRPLLNIVVRLALAVAVAAVVLTGACLLLKGNIEEVMAAFFLGPLEDEYAVAEAFADA